MSDFHPVTLFFILQESLGVWLWLLLALALVLLVGIVVAVRKLRHAGLPMKAPFVAALIAGLVVAAVATFAMPVWTLSDFGALHAAIDYAIAFLFALVPGGIVAALVFMLAARHCAARDAAA